MSDVKAHRQFGHAERGTDGQGGLYQGSVLRDLADLVRDLGQRDAGESPVLKGDHPPPFAGRDEIGRGRPYPHEAWYYTAGYYYFFGHYYASRIVKDLSWDGRPEYTAWLAATITGNQDPDGSWFDFPLYGYHKAYGTAYAILILQNCRDALSAGPPSS